MKTKLLAALAALVCGPALAASFVPGQVLEYDSPHGPMKVDVVQHVVNQIWRVHIYGSAYKSDTMDVDASKLRALNDAAAPGTPAAPETRPSGPSPAPPPAPSLRPSAPPSPRANAAAACDWSAWGVMSKSNLIALAGERDITNQDLVCQVRSRKVDFQLTADVRTALSKRASPELLAAIEESYQAKPAAAAPPAGAVGGQIPTGRYVCSKMAGIAPRLRYEGRGEVNIAAGGRYTKDGGSGAFSFDGKSRITWTSGPLAQQGWWADYAPGVFSVMNAQGQIMYSCNH